MIRWYKDKVLSGNIVQSFVLACADIAVSLLLLLLSDMMSSQQSSESHWGRWHSSLKSSAGIDMISPLLESVYVAPLQDYLLRSTPCSQPNPGRTVFRLERNTAERPRSIRHNVFLIVHLFTKYLYSASSRYLLCAGLYNFKCHYEPSGEWTVCWPLASCLYTEQNKFAVLYISTNLRFDLKFSYTSEFQMLLFPQFDSFCLSFL